jgi:hypothetical protein
VKHQSLIDVDIGVRGGFDFERDGVDGGKGKVDVRVQAHRDLFWPEIVTWPVSNPALIVSNDMQITVVLGACFVLNPFIAAEELGCLANDELHNSIHVSPPGRAKEPLAGYVHRSTHPSNSTR